MQHARYPFRSLQWYEKHIRDCYIYLYGFDNDFNNCVLGFHSFFFLGKFKLIY